jgi:hypothetical protein
MVKINYALIEKNHKKIPLKAFHFKGGHILADHDLMLLMEAKHPFSFSRLPDRASLH